MDVVYVSANTPLQLYMTQIEYVHYALNGAFHEILPSSFGEKWTCFNEMKSYKTVAQKRRDWK